MKTINDDMLQKIEAEIALVIDEGKNKKAIDINKTKEAAKILVDLAVNSRISDESAKSDYIAKIERICEKK